MDSEKAKYYEVGRELRPIHMDCYAAACKPIDSVYRRMTVERIVYKVSGDKSCCYCNQKIKG